MPRTSLTLLLIGLLASSADAAELTYEADVRPILKTHCFQCHGERGTTEGNLDLRLRRLVVQGGESGPAIIPGNVKNSLLIQRVSSGEMPPGDDQQLTPAEVSVLSRWVAAKAPTAQPEPASLGEAYFTAVEKNWWSLRPVVRPPPPAVAATGIATPIDAFILAKLSAQAKQHPESRAAFQFAPRADRATLIRRIYLDLLGVPPGPETVRQFVEDDRPLAWERVVDRVLASPKYGERWGRHWLDAAGYADSEGYTDEDRVREHAWRYRDYVIRAFNQGKPYAQFITEQLAGDELVGWPGTPLRPEIVNALAATGFLRMAPDGTASGGIDQGLARNQVIADTLQIMGTAIMGITIHCAQCHDHRYDPIPQRDYYRLRAIFEPALNWKRWRAPVARLVSLYSDADKRQRDEIEARAKLADAKRQTQVDFFISKTLEHELLMVPDELQQPLRAAFRTPPAKRSDKQKKLLEAHANIANITAGSLYLYDRRREARAKDLEKRHQEKLNRHLERIKNESLRILADWERGQVIAAFRASPESRSKQQQQLVAAHPRFGVTARSLAKMDQAAAQELKRYTTAVAEIRQYRIRDDLKKLSDEAKKIRDTIPKEHFLRILAEEQQTPPDTFVFHRGDHQQPKEKVTPRGLQILGAARMSPIPRLKTSGRRLQFARYLTSGKHPLVARVFVNRVWAHHFGRGIVSTMGDFGYLGERPTHPRLLDWLAAEFVESGWSVKRLHRLVLTSRVYQQSTVGSAELVQADPENRWLGRWPLRRLEAETLRDAMLKTSGQMNDRMYGEPVPVMEDEVGQIVLGRENLDGERKPTNPIPLLDEEFRRSVYVQVRRSRPLGVLESFDVPDVSPNCTKRPSSNVAPQSLMLMNSDFVVKVSTAMADRLMRAHPGRLDLQSRRAWELTYGQLPNEAQLKRAEDFLELQIKAIAADLQNRGTTKKRSEKLVAHRRALATYCQALLGSNRFLYIE